MTWLAGCILTVVILSTGNEAAVAAGSSAVGWLLAFIVGGAFSLVSWLFAGAILLVAAAILGPRLAHRPEAAPH